MADYILTSLDKSRVLGALTLGHGSEGDDPFIAIWPRHEISEPSMLRGPELKKFVADIRRFGWDVDG